MHIMVHCNGNSLTDHLGSYEGPVMAVTVSHLSWSCSYTFLILGNSGFPSLPRCLN